MDTLAQVIGYALMAGGGLALVVWLLSLPMDYAFHQMRANKAFALFVRKQHREKKGKPTMDKQTRYAAEVIDAAIDVITDDPLRGEDERRLAEALADFEQVDRDSRAPWLAWARKSAPRGGIDG